MHPSIVIHKLGYQKRLDGPPTLDFIPKTYADEGRVNHDEREVRLHSSTPDSPAPDTTEPQAKANRGRESKLRKIADQIAAVNARLLAEYKARQKA